MGKHRSGLLFGILAGTVLGILFAPKKGKELREQIQKEREEGGLGTDALKEGFVGMGKDMAGTAKNVYESESVQDNLSRAKSRAKEYAEIGREKAQEYADMGKKKMNKAAKDAIKNAKKMGKKATNFTKKKIGK